MLASEVAEGEVELVEGTPDGVVHGPFPAEIAVPVVDVVGDLRALPVLVGSVVVVV